MAETTIRVRDGLLQRLKTNAGIANDEAFAQLIGTSRKTLVDVRDGHREPSIGFAVGVADAFGLGLSEVVVWEKSEQKEPEAA